jgi:hypothetical protein
MRFTPKSEDEIAAENLWPAGEYGFEILQQVTFGTKTFTTEETVSQKSGAEMLRLVVKVYNNEGHFQTVIDYLMDAMPGKLRHACEACGLLDKYNSGLVTANDFIGKQGFLKLKIEKDKSGQYPDKNSIHDYVSPGEVAASAAGSPPPGHPANFDDSIPF